MYKYLRAYLQIKERHYNIKEAKKLTDTGVFVLVEACFCKQPFLEIPELETGVKSSAAMAVQSASRITTLKSVI